MAGVSMVWWSISGQALQAMLQRVADGDHPDVVYLEYFANSDREEIDGRQSED